MTEKTLTHVFGAGATQTSTQLIIDKADLVALGLGFVASANNKADQLFSALLFMAASTYTEAGYTSDYAQSIRVVQGTEGITTDFNTGTKYIEIPITATVRDTAPALTINLNNL